MTVTTESNTKKIKRRRGRKVQAWLSPERYAELVAIAGKGTIKGTLSDLIKAAAKKSGSTPLAPLKK